MTTTAWTDTFLEEKRRSGDPLADAVIRRIYEEGEVDAVNRLMAALVRDDGFPPSSLPAIVQDYLVRSADLPPADEAMLKAGEQIFADFGPEILLVLGFYSLPSAYAAKRGVQVLHRTAYLTKRPLRRVLETTQMVIDALSPGGLGPNGEGIRTLQKVRLMHAAVRHLLLRDPNMPWDDALGVPINQEDLAGTLMTFTYLVHDGLAKLGITLDEHEQAAYLYAFRRVGQLMGVDADLLPDTMDDAGVLAQRIFDREAAACPEGQAMMNALLAGLGEMMPIAGLSPSAARFFLQGARFTKADIPALLAVPAAGWTEHFFAWEAMLGGAIHAVADGPREGALLRWASQKLVQGFVDAERGGTRPAFAVPDTLRDLWSARAEAP